MYFLSFTIFYFWTTYQNIAIRNSLEVAKTKVKTAIKKRRKKLSDEPFYSYIRIKKNCKSLFLLLDGESDVTAIDKENKTK